MNEEQELAALEAELAALEADIEAKVEEASRQNEPTVPEPVVEEHKPKKKKSPKASDIAAVKPEDPKAVAIRQYGAQRLAAMRASKGLR